MAKTKPRKKTSSKRTRRATPTVRVPCSLLLDLEDELGNLAAALDCLPELRMMARAMHDVVDPPGRHRWPGSADRIGTCARELFNQRLDRYLTPAGKAFVHRADVVMARDLAETAEMIPAAVQWRLHRLEALIRLLKARR